MKLRPFSYPWIIRKHLEDAKTVLDVGCGDGTLMSMVNYDKKYEVTGIDLFKPYLEEAKKTGAYKKVIFGDVRKLVQKKQTFDIVLSSQVVEHLGKKDAVQLIETMEKIAKKKVIIGTTHGFFPFDPLEGKDNNPLQVHKSGWEISEFKKRDYKTYGQGLAIVYKPDGLAHKVDSFLLQQILFALSYGLSPLTYSFPQTSAYLVAVKEMKFQNTSMRR